jgi:hypothetical protein
LTSREATRIILVVTEEDQTQLDNEASEENGGSRRNLRSTISFPYSGLADAEQVAQVVHDHGDSATLDQIAAALDQTVTSGAFRTKIATSRIFGAVEVRRGTAALTPLGRRLVDPEKQKEARVEAFLHVPLYKQIYEAYKGHQLPAAAGIENRMEQLGVSRKQTDRARQALQKSAERAGFYEKGKDRLVIPALSGITAENENVNEQNRSQVTTSSLPAWAEQMWLALLSDDAASWSPEQLKAYVDGARASFKALS